MTEINTFDRILVADDLKKRGISTYTMRPGNDCVWVSHGRCECYYIIREGKIKEIIYD